MRPELTAGDWLERAEQAQDPAEVRRCLDEAHAAASRPYDLQQLLRAEQELGNAERLPALALRILEEFEDEDHDIFAFMDVVRLRAELGDRTGAIDALGRAEARLERLARSDSWRNRPVGDWCRLAETWLETLGEREEAQRCLASAEALAEKPGHLCDVAKGRHELLGDLASARALLERAEVQLPQEAVWGVANAWHTLEDPERAEALLARALQEATESGDVRRLALAWNCYEQPERAAAAAQRAGELARTPEEWIDVAELRVELRHDRSLVRQALDAATALTSEEDLDLRMRLAGAYHRWLGEPWSSQRGPLGRRPSTLRPVTRELPGFVSDAQGLFDYLRQQISRASLERIATSDWGIDFDEHLHVLTDLCASGLLPVVREALTWHPREVLELTRWKRGERVDHLARALSTTILSFQPHAELNNTVPYLVESALVLGDPVPDLAEGMLVWLHDTGEWPDLSPLLGLVLLRLARGPEDVRLPSLMTLAEEQYSEDFLKYCTGAEQWASLTRAVAGPLAQTRPEVAGRLLSWLGG